MLNLIKRFKGNKSNVMNDDCKDIIKSIQYLDNVPKQVNIPMTQVVDSYSSASEQRTKLFKLTLEKVYCNVNIPHIEKAIKVVSQITLQITIVKYPNKFKDSFVNRVTKFQTTVGHFVLELLNTMIFF